MRSGGALSELLLGFAATQLRRPVEPSVTALARTLAHRGGPGLAGILYYGSCLRDGLRPDAVADFYLITDRGSPRVQLATVPVAGCAFPCKLTFLSRPTLARRTEAFLPVLWARLAQPCRLVWARDGAAEAELTAAVAKACQSFWRESAALSPSGTAGAALQAGLAASYRAEWRAERPGRAAQIVQGQQDHFDELAAVCPDLPYRSDAILRWRLRWLIGPPAHLGRLIAGAFTVTGGLDYLAWKIERHSGRPVRLQPWMRRVPLLAGLGLFIRLRWRGQVR